MNDQSLSRYRMLPDQAKQANGRPAEDLLSGRAVNLHFLPAGVTLDAAREERLRRDLQVLADLNHPHICPVLDLVETSTGPVAVTARLEGQTLAQWQSRFFLTADLLRVTSFGMQICDALTATHTRGLVHGAIRPSTLWVSPKLEILILYFGMSEWAPASEPESRPATARESSAGVLHWIRDDRFEEERYRSPEQVRQETVDTRSDIFSLGAVLFYLLTNHYAFQGGSAEAIRASVLRRSPDTRPILDPQLRLMLEKALEKERGTRYQNLVQLRSILRGLHDDLTEREARQPQGKTIANYRILQPVRAEDRFFAYDAEHVVSGEHAIFVSLPGDYIRDSAKFESFQQRLRKEAAEHPNVFIVLEFGTHGPIAFVVLYQPWTQPNQADNTSPDALLVPRSSQPISPFRTHPLKPVDFALYVGLAILGTEIVPPRMPPKPAKVALAPITIVGAIVVFLAMGACLAFAVWYIFFR
jgi:serine/threonine protein kinase